MHGNFKVGGISVQGTAHQRNETPCQDANIYHSDNGITLLAVADGLGSCAHSDIASKIAVNAAKEYCQKSHFIGIKKLFRYCRGKILRHAKQHHLDIDQLHTTLLVFVAIGDRLLAGQIGDGAIILYDGTQFIRLFQRELLQSRGALNVTATLLQEDYSSELYSQEMVIANLRSVFVMTDGITPVSTSYKDESAYLPFFEYLLDNILPAHFESTLLIKRAENLLISEQFSRHSQDDKTLTFAISP